MDIKVIRGTQSLALIDQLLYGILSVFLANIFIPGVKTIEIILLYSFTNFIVAPFVANQIVKFRVNSYIKENYLEMANKKKGELDFWLYTIQYKIAWNYK